MHQNCCIHCSMSNVAKNISNNWCRICLFVTVNKRNTSPLWLAASVIDLKLQEYIITVFKNCILLINQFLIYQSISCSHPSPASNDLRSSWFKALVFHGDQCHQLPFLRWKPARMLLTWNLNYQCFLHETLITHPHSTLYLWSPTTLTSSLTLRTSSTILKNPLELFNF